MVGGAEAGQVSACSIQFTSEWKLIDIVSSRLDPHICYIGAIRSPSHTILSLHLYLYP